MSNEPESLVLQLLRGIRADIARLDTKIDETKTELRSEINSLRADVASDFVAVRAEMAAMRKETQEQISGLRRAVIEYHSSVVGHGLLISELEARLRRVEQHLDLPSIGPN
jgi:chromosome segregation ATPase